MLKRILFLSAAFLLPFASHAQKLPAHCLYGTQVSVTGTVTEVGPTHVAISPDLRNCNVGLILIEAVPASCKQGRKVTATGSYGWGEEDEEEDGNKEPAAVIHPTASLRCE